jgi:hypothetical protein
MHSFSPLSPENSEIQGVSKRVTVMVPWVTECLRELSREAATAICAVSNCCRRFAANTLRRKHNPWASTHGYVLSPLRGYKQRIFTTHASGYHLLVLSQN